MVVENVAAVAAVAAAAAGLKLQLNNQLGEAKTQPQPKHPRGNYK